LYRTAQTAARRLLCSRVMTRKNKPKKLSLSKSTLRVLGRERLQVVAAASYNSACMGVGDGTCKDCHPDTW
jgi:hypothetical protein